MGLIYFFRMRYRYMDTQIFRVPDLFEVRRVMSKGGCERPHTHNHLVISAVAQVSVLFQINTELVTLLPNQITAIGPHILHHVNSYPCDVLELYVLEVFTIPQDLAGFDQIHLQFFKQLSLNSAEDFRAFMALCQFLLSDLSIQDKSLAYQDWLALFLQKRYRYAALHSNDGNQLAIRIRQLLDDTEHERPNYQKIAEHISRGQVQCNRIFKQAYGVSMQAYFLSQKAQKARERLYSSDGLSEIALSCGFYDQSHFCKVFKEIFQLSPSAYRKLMRYASA